jgi:hypothetical protein
MASASLVHPIAIPGGTAYQVETWPFEIAPFAGPDDRDWARFDLVHPARARYEWRTRADRVLAAILALEDGASAAEVVADRSVTEYLARIAAADPALHGAPALDLAAAVLPGLVWGDLVEAAGPLSAYATDEDVYLHDAAVALELPEWGRRARAVDGRAGAFVVLDDGRTLAELEAWLAAR